MNAGGRERNLMVWLVASAALMLIGAFGPWVQVLGQSVNGTDGSNDGWFVVGATLLGGLLFYRARDRRSGAVWAFLGGAGGFAITLYDRQHAQHEIANGGILATVAHVGWGLNLALLASLSMMIAGAAWDFHLRSSERAGDFPVVAADVPTAPPDAGSAAEDDQPMTIKVWHLLLGAIVIAAVGGLGVMALTRQHGSNGNATNTAAIAQQSDQQPPRQVSLVTAESNVRSAIPDMEAYYSDNSSYSGATTSKLRVVYDSGLSSTVAVGWAHSQRYCLESTVGSAVVSVTGPGGEIRTDPCTDGTSASGPSAAPSTPVTTPASTSIPSAPSMTVSQAQAVEAAKSYLSMGTGFSRAGLIQQLSSSAGEGFSKADAIFAVDHLHVNWNQQAVESAKGYISMGGFSRASLIQQLSSRAGEQFTYAQAVYAANQVGL